MNTYQVLRTVCYEYFIEAPNEDEALMRIDKGDEQPCDTTEIALQITDRHDGTDWIVEPVGSTDTRLS